MAKIKQPPTPGTAARQWGIGAPSYPIPAAVTTAPPILGALTEIGASIVTPVDITVPSMSSGSRQVLTARVPLSAFVGVTIPTTVSAQVVPIATLYGASAQPTIFGLPSFQLYSGGTAISLILNSVTYSSLVLVVLFPVYATGTVASYTQAFTVTALLLVTRT